LPGGLAPNDYDYFHELIVHEEIARLGTPGFFDGIGGGLIIGLPPVLLHASPELKARVVPDCLYGRKQICLAITEPFAGSDVQGLRCEGVKSQCGKFWIVNGVKKWITNGTACDWFTTAVKTGNAQTLLLIERGEGVSTKRITTSYSPSAGTAYVEFDNVKVPVENMLGQENHGFKAIMHNFNHERWYICVYLVRMARLVIEVCTLP
jgi:alkylation response protein AidB-like acyl-CoA dehydrogenase